MKQEPHTVLFTPMCIIIMYMWSLFKAHAWLLRTSTLLDLIYKNNRTIRNGKGQSIMTSIRIPSIIYTRPVYLPYSC